MKDDVKKFLESKKFKVKTSRAGKIIAKFEKDKSSSELWSFLTTDPSCRAVFNSLVKVGYLDYNTALRKLPELLRSVKTSFVFSTSCECGNILDRPNKIDSNFKNGFNKSITCPACNKKQEISKDDYSPIYEPTSQDFDKVLYFASENGPFEMIATLECYACNKIELLRNRQIDLNCPICGRRRVVSTAYFPLPGVDELTQGEEKQGYWLEWFIWKKLKEHGAEAGLEIRKEGLKIELDIVLLLKDGLWVFECKDGQVDSSFLSKLEGIKKVAHKFVLVTTAGRIDPNILSTAKRILRDKLVIITSEKIDSIQNIFEPPRVLCPTHLSSIFPS